ncbi:transglycosylase domain-containing protein [Candidatus Saccharibacteria bacterium]|nr:transglycosylase domain-containing protein [Candidatus Saccharibacteria bacterium]MBI3338112.1 transglycosylase domain-containing protein [Candidatus Saccharibacteria bacterium]
MNSTKKNPSGRRGNVGRKSKNTFTTKSGKTIRIHRNIGERLLARRATIADHKALRLAGLPKSRIKRFIYRLHPKRLYKYWFSREGAIMALKIAGIGLIAGFIMLIGLFAYFRKDLPNLRDISGKNIGGSISYYDRSGKTLLYEDYDAVKRIPVKDEEISKFIKDATVAIEDKDFFHHGGFDVRGITRAGFSNITGSGNTQGGSTITQQLVKLTQNWTKDRSYTRKAKELILAIELERSYSKQEILVGYLNAAPYGSIDYGVEAASRDYFNKPAKDLTLDEATFLAAIPKSPGFYSPYNTDFVSSGGKDALVGRQHYILDLMEQQGKITKKERDNAKKIDTVATVKPRKPKYAGIKAPYFVLTAKEELQDRLGAKSVKVGGWKIITTLDLDKQTIAEQQVAKGLTQVKRQGGDIATFVAEDVKTGQVVALVGGPDFTNQEYGENNYARDYQLPPGSSFKPYDYISLMENTTNFGAGSVLYDTQGAVDGYPCTNKALPEKGGNCIWNYDRRFIGPVTLRYAIGGSRNIPAVKAMVTAGINPTIGIAHKLMTTYKDGQPTDRGRYRCYKDGVDINRATVADEQQCYSSSAIGDGAYLRLDEHVHGYSTIARNGLNIPQTYILKIQDASGKTIDEWKPSKGNQAVRPDSAYIVGDMISDPNASYFPPGNKPQRYNTSLGTWKFGVKTGTTNDSKDGWMMGFSTQYAAGVWVGYHNRQRAMTGSMENMTLPIWQGWMRAVHANIKPEERAKPSGVQTLPAFIIRSHVGFGSIEPSPSTDLYPSWYSQKKVTGKKQTIDIVSDKLATDCTPARAKKEVTDTDASSFSGDRFAQNTANTNQTDDIHKCEDTKPSLSNLVLNADGSISVTVSQGTHPISSDKYKGTVNFIVNGQVIQSFNVTYDQQIVTLPAGTAPAGSSVSAEVIDSVLYDGQSPNSVTVAAATASPLVLSATRSGAEVTFTWTGSSVSVTVYKGSGTVVCNGTASGCSSFIVPTGTSVYAKDSTGKTSDPITAP